MTAPITNIGEVLLTDLVLSTGLGAQGTVGAERGARIQFQDNLTPIFSSQGPVTEPSSSGRLHSWAQLKCHPLLQCGCTAGALVVQWASSTHYDGKNTVSLFLSHLKPKREGTNSLTSLPSAYSSTGEGNIYLL